MKKKWLWIGLAVVLIAAVVIGNVARQSGKKGVGVQLARVRVEDITSRVRAPGKIEPRTQVKISADVMGKIVKLTVKEGDPVKRGQLMLQLDDTQYRSTLGQAQAALSSARARHKEAQNALKISNSTYERQKALYEQKLLSPAEWDQASQAHEAAQSLALTAAQEVSRSEAAVQGAADNLRKTRFEAPIDGVVSALNVEAGEIVIMGTMNNPGTQILSVSDMSRMLVRADVDETDVVDITLGQKAKITVDAMPDTSFAGTVVEIGNTAKRSQTAAVEGQTNFEVKVVFDQTVPEVRPGMTADVDVETATHAKAMGVPIQAVVVRTERELERAAKKGGKDAAKAKKDAQAAKKKKKASGMDAFAVSAEDDTAGRKEKEIAGVFVVREGEAKFVPVRTGIASETSIEVFGDLKSGESVVSGPYKALRELKPGSKVKPETPGMARGGGKK
jgi:HlyD family secretion protein